jgi:hypothetical protein
VREARKAAALFPGQVEVIRLDAMGSEADAYGIITTPLIVVGEQIASAGRVIPASKLEALIQTELGG